MMQSQFKRAGKLLAQTLAAMMVLTVGTMSALPAEAAGPPVTFSLAAVQLGSGEPLTTVNSGSEFNYTASVGCPDPSGCGPAKLTMQFPADVEFLASAFTPPNGVTVDVTPVAGPATGKLVTLEWGDLAATSVVFLPSRLSATAAASLNGTVQTASATLTAGEGADTTEISGSADFTLRVFQKASLGGVTKKWSTTSVGDGSRASVTSTTTGVASANSASALVFTEPSAETIPAASIAVAEAFDLTKLTLNQNPAGATVTFLIEGGASEVRTLSAGDLSADAPAATVGYTVTVGGLPSVAEPAAARTVSVTADYTLRDAKRSDGSSLIDPTVTARAVRATALVANTVADPAPGDSGRAEASAREDISVVALVPTISRLLDLVTESGDLTSVYRSEEPSTTTIRASNTGVPVLSSISVKTSTEISSFLDFQALTAAPKVTFPRGATIATIQYLYASAPKSGEAQEFALGSTTPGASIDGRELADVAGFILTFSAPEDGEIVGECVLSDDSCAAIVSVESKLRLTRLTTGAAINAPSSNPGTTSVAHTAEITAVAATGTVVSQKTNSSTLSIIKPQFTAKLEKKIGDDGDRTVYPLTGVAKAGDYYDSTKTTQSFSDHKFRLTASTDPAEKATELLGADEIVLTDPQTTPTKANLGNNPFNAIKFSGLPDADAVCVDSKKNPVASSTSMMVWVVDRSVNPTTVTKVAYDASVDLDLVVGVEYSVQPSAASGRFPIDLSCSTPDNTTVKFRDSLVSSGVAVSPATIGAVSTPGLLAVGNTALLSTGQNTATATGSDSMYLLELERAGAIKHYDTDAKNFGIQGQHSATAFLLAGVPASEDTVKARIVDGGGSATGSSLDVFAFVGARDAKVGPDQKMTISFFDRTGNPVGPTGTVTGPTEHKGVELTAEEIENSQSDNYLAVQGEKRKIEWSSEITPEQADSVYSVQVEVTRSDTSKPLQRFGAFSVVTDMTLRSNLKSNPAKPVAGAVGGVTYFNFATASSLQKSGSWLDSSQVSAKYSVFAPDQLFGDSAVVWRNLTGSTVLVAQNETTSRITVDASNKTAIGVSGVLPENQWSATGSIAVGVDRIGVSVGGDPDLGANPFAINSFNGVESMIWPEKNDAPKTGTEAQKRVAGRITYTYADGTKLVVAAPVGATAAQMNPPEADWSKVVNVSVVWQQDGKYIGLKRSAATVQGRLVFQMTLLNKVREGYSYKFVSGDPTDLTSGQSIDGAYQTEGGKVSQHAEIRPSYSAAFGDLKLDTSLATDRAVIDVADSSVAVSLRNTTAGTLYRDLLPTAAWTLAVKNTGNIPVSALRTTTSSQLLDGPSWPDTDPVDYAVEPGSLFDAFDVTRARVVYPSGARSATVWARGVDGAWSDPITAANNSYFLLPALGNGPKTWGDVTGFRVQFTGDEILGMRIATQAEGSLLIETKLRATLRSDATVISPATKLPQDQTQWQVPGTGAGASYLGTFVAPLAEMNADTAIAYITPGSPSPKVNKYAGSYNVASNTGSTTANANPGAWTNFYIVVANLSGASSNLSNLQVVDTLPTNLVYNAANTAAEWSVVSGPAGVSTTPVFTETTGADTRLRWAWPEGQSLKPNERVVLKVPLQMRDGVATGSSAVNSARLVASGIPGAPVASTCESEDSASANCVSTAAVTSLRNDSVRIESYAQAGAVTSKTLDGDECSPSTIADWQDGTWIRNPCVVETSTGGTMTYRLKLINSGNNDVQSLRFVDELPRVGDFGAVLPGGRGSEWTPNLVPGSVRLLAGTEAESLGARGDASVTGSFRYSSTADACVLDPDAYAGQKTLACAAGTWTSAASVSSAALGGDLAFDSGSLLRGGEFVIVEFKMSVPTTSTTGTVTWNSAAITGRATTVSDWLPAAESAKSGGRTQDTTLKLSLALADTVATKWHLKAEQYLVYYSCLAPGETTPLTGHVIMSGISKADGVETATIQNLPRGAECRVTDEHYQPLGTATSPQYGSAAAGATGYGFTTDPVDPIVLDSDASRNVIAATNAFVASSVKISAVAEGDAVSYIPAGSKFQVDATCEFGGYTETYGPFLIESGGETIVSGLPVGANCTFTETDHLGASAVSAAVDGVPADLNSARGLRMLAIEPGSHTLDFVNTFTAGGDLTILKTVQVPKRGTTVGDVTFGISCEMGGVALDLGARGEMTLTFGPGATSASGSISDLPVGSACKVTETHAGGANIAAPDKTVTILNGTPVTVEMTNVFSPALLELNVAVDGSAADQSWVPKSYDVAATCTRELTVGGEAVTVTDFSGSLPVKVGKKVAVRDLPQGSRCAVTQPDNRGAKATRAESQTEGVVDHSTAKESSIVDLRGPNDAGAAQATAVLITNTFEADGVDGSKKNPGDAKDGAEGADGGLPLTGAQASMIWIGGALLLVVGLGLTLLAMRRRRRDRDGQDNAAQDPEA